jgi:uncharacterized protein (UPF0210 family)
MISPREILETINMISNENLDIRTVTLGISLRDCVHPDIEIASRQVYEKITRIACDLVKTGEEIERDFGIPIINKRIAVTPISIIGESSREIWHRLLWLWTGQQPIGGKFYRRLRCACA